MSVVCAINPCLPGFKDVVADCVVVASSIEVGGIEDVVCSVVGTPSVVASSVVASSVVVPTVVVAIVVVASSVVVAATVVVVDLYVVAASEVDVTASVVVVSLSTTLQKMRIACLQLLAPYQPFKLSGPR